MIRVGGKYLSYGLGLKLMIVCLLRMVWNSFVILVTVFLLELHLPFAVSLLGSPRFGFLRSLSLVSVFVTIQSDLGRIIVKSSITSWDANIKTLGLGDLPHMMNHNFSVNELKS